MENLGKDQDPLEDVKFDLKPVALDFQRLAEMADSERGHSHMQCLVKHWEYKRASDVQVLEEELDLLCQQRKEIEQKIVQKRQQILEEQRIHDQSCDTVKGKVPILDEGKITPSCDHELEMDAEHGSVSYWKERAMQLEETVYQEHKMDAECDIISFWKERVKQLEEKLQACFQRERSLVDKTEGSIRNQPSHTQFEGLSRLLKRADFFLHLVLQSAPIVIAHQDADLRYRFIFNHYPTLADEDVIGKTDYEIWSGEGIEEMNTVKREVMATGIATKREFVLNTPVFGAKTFVTYIEPVFSKVGETIGVNSVAMDITDQVKRRNKMMDIRVREAVQKALESKLEAMKIQEP
ncbi:unnamed protein product [Urochloa decumbens]|uniref:PAS fold-4 domain-containing protein n=1 Tax=Urochloa decumbens TaxID=240449 RepID=A0ABC9E049_9POAL